MRASDTKNESEFYLSMYSASVNVSDSSVILTVHTKKIVTLHQNGTHELPDEVRDHCLYEVVFRYISDGPPEQSVCLLYSRNPF